MRNSSPIDDAALDAAVARADDADLAEAAAEAKAAFHLRMRARGIQDLAVLRAFELVPRHLFVPHRHLDLAARDLALPIDCGQTLNAPWLVARMIAALAVERTHRVLEIGAGTGFATAVLAHLASDVIALERFQSLATAAQARLADLGIANAAIVWGDGLAVPATVEPFDRIIVHGLLAAVPDQLVARLAQGGALICALICDGGQHIVRVDKGAEGTTCSVLFPSSLQAIVPGLAATL